MDKERAVFSHLQTDQQREHFIEQFWLRPGPTAGTPENEFMKQHYRRIAYSNRNFRTEQCTAGWKTDRGRIYIVFGPRDEREAHPNVRQLARSINTKYRRLSRSSAKRSSNRVAKRKPVSILAASDPDYLPTMCFTFSSFSRQTYFSSSELRAVAPTLPRPRLSVGFWIVDR